MIVLAMLAMEFNELNVRRRVETCCISICSAWVMFLAGCLAMNRSTGHAMHVDLVLLHTFLVTFCVSIPTSDVLFLYVIASPITPFGPMHWCVKYKIDVNVISVGSIVEC